MHVDHGEISGTFLVHTVEIKPIKKVKISGKLITSGISDIAIASVYFEKNRLKKMIMIIIIITITKHFFTSK